MYVAGAVSGIGKDFGNGSYACRGGEDRVPALAKIQISGNTLVSCLKHRYGMRQ
jgi:hypothetical protein